MSIVASARLLGGRYLLLGQPRRGVTASAQRVTSTTSDVFKRTRWDWQTRALYYYDTIPEIWYAGQFYSKGLVRLKLIAEVYDAETDEWAEAPNSPASEMLDRIADPGGGRSGLLGNYGRLRFLTGEANLLVTNPNMPDERWEMVSKDELRIMPDGRTYERIRLAGQRGEVLQAAPDDESAWEQIPDQAVVYRLWHRHPRFSLLADCPMRAVLDVAEELLLMTLAVRAQVRSRIARSGMLLVPTEIDPPPPEAVPGEDMMESPFARDLSQHMMAALANEGDASSLVPLIVRGDGEALDKIRHLKLAIDQGYPEAQLRTEAISRLANGLDMPREVLLGTADVNHWGCVSDDTEILTRDRGWMTHESVKPSDEVMTLNHDTGAAEWQPVLAMNRYDVVDAEMLAIENRFHSSLTTLNHRWPTLCAAEVYAYDGKGTVLGYTKNRRWTTSEQLNTADSIIRAAPAILPADESWTDALVELMAWVWTEGSIRERAKQSVSVSIYQSHRVNPENVERIRGALTRLYGPAVVGELARGGRGHAAKVTQPRWRETRRSNGMTIFKLNIAASRPFVENAPGRIVKRSFVESLTAHQLDLFIDTSIRGDGHVMGNGTLIIGQKNPEALEALELAAILRGRATRISASTHDGFTRHTQHTLTIGQRPASRVTRSATSRERYTGVVWCPTTPNGSWLARRRGNPFYTGNSWQIDQQVWQSHLQPVAEELCGELTAAVLIPALVANGVDPDEAERYRITYDASEIVNHPNRGRDAVDLYDRGELAGPALREAKGFDEENAPTDEEVKRYIGIRTGDAGLAVNGVVTENSGGGGRTDTRGPLRPQRGDVPGDNPGPPAETPGGEQARLLGAAESALQQCRRTAGSKVLQKLPRAQRGAFEMIPRGQVYAKLREVDGPLRFDARDLVRGGAEHLLATLLAWGYDEPGARVVCDLVERHAAESLHEDQAAALPLDVMLRA